MNNRNAIDRWADLRRLVAAQDHVLSPEVYDGVRRQLTAHVSNPESLARIAPEYGKQELLLNVDARGAPVRLPDAVFADWRETAERYPGFGQWFQAANEPLDGSPALLAGRWLCHLLGLRHRTIQLFVDHPTLDDYTLVQVRGLSKVEFPGCFDLPAAGHVVGLDSPLDALHKELAEELSLGVGDLEGLELVAIYDYRSTGEDRDIQDVELCTLFRGRLKADRWSRIRFADGEVAALAIFSVPGLVSWLDRSPERIAAGLLSAWPFYLRAR